MSEPQKRYRIHRSLQDFEGAKSGRLYTCTRGAIYEAPQGEFKALGSGAYSLLPTGGGDDTTGDDTTDDASSSQSDQ
jgi:hypothetical protein